MRRQSEPEPDLAALERMAARVFAALPKPFREACGNVQFRVAEIAPQDVLDELEIDDPLDLMGLFEGIGLPQAGEADTGDLPNRIWLYRAAIIDYCNENSDPLESVVAHVLIHEIGHHMGFDDDDLDRIERAQ